jgi:hypothetical protein
VPDQFEGYKIKTGKAFSPKQKDFRQTLAKFSYDYTNKREAEIEEFLENGKKVIVHTIKRFGVEPHETGMQIVIDKKLEFCEVSDIVSPMQRMCVDDKAKHLHTHKVGDSEGAFIEVDGYEFVDKDIIVGIEGEHKNDTSGGCMPISRIEFGTDRNEPYIRSTYYGDLTHGIKDPSMFKIPDYCSTNRKVSSNVFQMRIGETNVHSRRGRKGRRNFH